MIHEPLQNVLNTAAGIILRKRKLDRVTTDVWDQLHWLPIQQRIEYKVCILLYKCLHQATPTDLTELCSPVSESANRGHCTWWPCSTPLQNNEIWPKMFCCFWSEPVELTPIVSSWPVTDTELSALLKTAILQSFWNSSVALPWQFRL